MEDVIEVLQRWAEYQKGHPTGGFEDFCRFYLARPKGKRPKASNFEKAQPADTDSMFMMTVSRSTLAFWVYMRIALRDTPLPTVEDIMLCAALFNLGESRKTDIINFAMMEISTGTGNLNRLIEKGFIEERIDPDDKRSKLIVLSSSGAKALKQCFAKAKMARDIFLTDLTEDDKKLVANILNPLQEKHSKLAIARKGKSIEEIHKEVMGDEKK
ncbi:DNA-binding transcriptional regulator, MarR family [Chryseolinea serpens]|uniref:DNA-binding transcriptional regulator, MarR family n=1 Tax=Chryseolinea serpens TaxID=947013 RepID=A0A1M5QSW2_9BACT|nr:MarR family transcriptional regulator [Chryseolinea serpens]SHH17245.1 DNA-binding transcriptional regulator, MarR family [Chryseolinea serpens]